jgi:hypothetical protein
MVFHPRFEERLLAVDVHPDDKEKRGFSTVQVLWHYTFILFGLCNPPANFERLMETVLLGFTYDASFVYLDDMIIIGRTFQEYLLNLRKMFERFREARKIPSGKVSTFTERSISLTRGDIYRS